MDLYEAIEKRRTIRGFIKSPPDEVVKKIIMAGTKAMSANNQQPWEFIIVDDPELVEKISEEKYKINYAAHPPGARQQKTVYKNCKVIAACYRDGPGYLWSMWAAIQNISLAATAEGLGIVPSTLWDEGQKNVEKLLGLPADYHLATMVLIGVQRGYPRVKTPKIKRRPEFSWLHRNKFGVSA